MARSKSFVALLTLCFVLAGCLDKEGKAGAPAAGENDPGTPTTTDGPSASPAPEPSPTSTPQPPAPPEDPDDENETAPALPPAPVAVAAITSTSPKLQVQGQDVYFEVKTPLVFDAGASTGENLTYRWDLGDGRNATTPKTEGTYLMFGDYRAVLVVTDAFNRTSELVFFLHAAPPMAPPGDPAVVKTATGQWTHHVDPATQKPIVAGIEFAVPYPTVRLDVRVTWTVGPVVGHAAPVAEIEATVLNVTGKKVAGARSMDLVHLTILDDAVLVPGYWKLELTPHRAPGVTYQVTLIAWTTEPLITAFKGHFEDPTSPAVNHDLLIGGRIGTLWADLQWDGADPDAAMCGPADRATGHLSLTGSIGAAQKLSSDGALVCEATLLDKAPGEAISEGATWQFRVASAAAAKVDYVLTLVYA